MTSRYAPFYCEENVWWVLREGALDDGHAVFIMNAAGSVALWSQRASNRPDGLTLWDYHVVALGKCEEKWQVVDLDCTVGQPLPVSAWVAASFPLAGAVPEDVEPMFRVVPAETLFTAFHTDRSHMRDEEGEWYATPPKWESISDRSNLSSYLDPTNTDVPGEVLDLERLMQRYG